MRKGCMASVLLAASIGICSPLGAAEPQTATAGKAAPPPSVAGTPPSPAQATPPAATPQPDGSGGTVGEFEPVLHAQQAKITTCMDVIVG